MSDDKNKRLQLILERLKDKINPTEEQLEKLKELTEKYSDKSDEEILVEIVKLNKMFSESMSKEEYEDKIRKLEKIRPLLNEEQRSKLDKVLEIIKNS